MNESAVCFGCHVRLSNVLSHLVYGGADLLFKRAQAFVPACTVLLYEPVQIVRCGSELGVFGLMGNVLVVGVGEPYIKDVRAFFGFLSRHIEQYK